MSSEPEPREASPGDQAHVNVGNQILALLGENTESPGEALFLLNQLSFYVWEHYQLDWKGTPECPVAETRKQRYLDFVAELLNNLNIQDKPKEAAQ